VSRHCLLTRIEWKPFSLPRSFSKWLLGGTRKSRCVVASSIIWILRNKRLSKSDGIFFDRTSSTKKSRNQRSRKLTIIPQLHHGLMYHSTVQPASSIPELPKGIQCGPPCLS